MFFLSLSLFFLCFLFYKKELYDIKKDNPKGGVVLLFE